MVKLWLRVTQMASSVVFISKWNEDSEFSFLWCVEMCNWWYWMEDCNIRRASPVSTDTSSDTTIWHETILHTLTNLWGPSQPEGGDTVQHINQPNMQILSNCHFQISNLRKLGKSVEEAEIYQWRRESVISLMSWSFLLQCSRFVHKTDRSGGPGHPERRRISSA